MAEKQGPEVPDIQRWSAKRKASLVISFKEECVWRHRFESITHAQQVIGQWLWYYNTRRLHQALGYRTPAATAQGSAAA